MAIFAEHRPKLLSAALAAFWAVAGASPAAQTLDRVVASVESRAITESDVETQYRLELLLDGRDPKIRPPAGELARARDRLIDQRLLLDEAEAEGLELEVFVPRAEETFRAARSRYESREEFESALAVVGLNEAEVVRRLAEMERALQVIERRLRPAAWVEVPEVERYYREVFVPDFEKRASGPPPPLEKVEDEIREILIQEKVDELLDTWLSELRGARGVRIHAESAALEAPAGEAR